MSFLSGTSTLPQTLLAAVFLASMAACTAGPRLVDHSFGFDASGDTPNIEVLDYRYGDSNFPGFRGCPKHYSHCNSVPQSANINGQMPLGDDLFVKWRIRSTREIFEDTVNLRSIFPKNMNQQRIRFVISGPQLYIFVISLDRKIEPNPCPSQEERHRLDHSSIPLDRVFSMYCSKSITQIYPNQPASQEFK